MHRSDYTRYFLVQTSRLYTEDEIMRIDESSLNDAFNERLRLFLASTNIMKDHNPDITVSRDTFPRRGMYRIVYRAEIRVPTKDKKKKEIRKGIRV